ncbi:MAG: ABC transporter ATP-binding protein [Acidimicrobiia bacterium]|jgi:multiple sugar transport system ATP-binding protein|nr:ABC transporter ATP-binding protein [Acidimicrobiia bacterium]
MAGIIFSGVTKRFPDGTVAVDDLDLDVRDGELLAVVGPSGCGKSTALRIAAGLEAATEGRVTIGGRDVTDVAPGDRDLAIVFQDYALYPHLSAYENLAFALRARHREHGRMPRREIDRRVREVAALLGIDALLDRRPRALSGGERQRVAMGRAIVRRPCAFLMDEPLSNLDAKLRVQLRTEIRRLHDELGTTFCYVTHDQTEALTIGDRVAVLRRGRLQQLEEPQRLYDAPVNLFVAGFIGSPPTNLLLAPVAEGDGEVVARVGPWSIPLPAAVVDGRSHVVVGIRPEHLEEPRFAADFGGAVTAEVTVDLVEPLGGSTLVHFAVDARPATVPDDDAPGEGVDGAADGDDHDERGVAPASRVSGPTTMIAAVDARTQVAAGGRITLAVDTGRVRFFDPVTGLALGAVPVTADR